MSYITTSQYIALHELLKWHRKFNHQVIEISGTIGTGIDKIISQFIDICEYDPREVMYLSMDQGRVLELAYKRYHAYFLNRIIYNYTRIVCFDSLPVFNPQSKSIQYTIEKKVKSKLPDDKYRLMIVYDSSLLNKQTLQDLMSFGLPIILIRDPYLLPAKDSYVYAREADIHLWETDAELMKQPLTYFANQILNDRKLTVGTYDTVSVISNKNLNLYNFKSSDMILTLTEDTANEINTVYRKKILNIEDSRTVPNERVIAMNTLYREKLTNPDEKHVKVFLTKGTVGTLSKCPRHALSTKWIPVDFRPEFYHDSFEELYIDRHYLNGITNISSRQQVPDEILYVKYAYALNVALARLSHWEKGILICDPPDVNSEVLKMLMYTAITRCTQALTIVI